MHVLSVNILLRKLFHAYIEPSDKNLQHKHQSALAEANATIRQLEWQIQSLDELLGGLEW